MCLRNCNKNQKILRNILHKNEKYVTLYLGGEGMNKVKYYRERKNYSKTFLAEGIGVSRRTIYNIETGKNECTVYIALRLAKILETTVEELFSGG